MRVSVVGGSRVSDRLYQESITLGKCLAERGHTVVCGGRTGVMEGVCRGARAEGGETIGILPGRRPEQANEFVTSAVATGLGNGRNVLVVLNGRAVVAVDGSYGTLSEVALALDAGKPVAGIETHDVEGVEPVDDAVAAVEYVERTVDR